jgi:hypothetical protein
MPGNATNMPLLIPDGLFTCPRCGPTNAVTQLIATGSLANPLAGRCRRCEHPYQLTVGAPSTTTTGSANVQGATVLTVAAGAAFSTVGAWIVVDSGSVDGGAEVLKTSGAGGSTTIPIAATPLRLTHAAGATVQTGTLGPLGPMT